MSRKGGSGEGGWGQLQRDMHVVAARLGCQSTKAGTGGPRLALAAWTGFAG